MKGIFIWCTVFFNRIIDSFAPYYRAIRQNSMVKSISSMFDRNKNQTFVVPGYMEHDPRHLKKK